MNHIKTSEEFFSPRNLGIVGSRSFCNYSYGRDRILKIIESNSIFPEKIVSGGALGSDQIAEKFAKEFNLDSKIILPDWSNGRGAGLNRNTEIIKESDFIIAFWDGESRGTLDSINKAKKMGKKIHIEMISPESINEGVRIKDDEFVFDFKSDEKDDLLKLKYNKNFITKKKIKGVTTYFTYKINKKIDKKERRNLLNYIKKKLNQSEDYDKFINKSVIGLFNNPYLEIRDIDLILMPESSSDLNFDLANKIKSKIPNAMLVKESFLKNKTEEILIDYKSLLENGSDPKTIREITKSVEKFGSNNKFEIKKITPRFRKFISNFLNLDIKSREMFNRITEGKILIVDDIVTEGTTFTEMERIIQNYSPKNVILFSLIG
jgi:hypothetical protein